MKVSDKTLCQITGELINLATLVIDKRDDEKSGQCSVSYMQRLQNEINDKCDEISNLKRNLRHDIVSEY